MFTDNDLKEAIAAGIFDTHNNVIASPAQVIRFFEQWAAKQKRDLRHAAAEIAITYDDKDLAHNAIMMLP